MLALGVIGVALVIYTSFNDKTQRNRILRLVGAILLIVYSTFMENLVFMALSILILIEAVIEYRKHHKK